jgi:hypothetical protein
VPQEESRIALIPASAITRKIRAYFKDGRSY